LKSYLMFTFTFLVAMALSGVSNAQDVVLQPTLEKRQVFEANGFEKWEWLKSTCADCELSIVPLRAEVETPKVEAFLQALGDHKAELLQIYKIHGAEYNLLAHMAVGILGRESKFFKSPRYYLKEAAPWAVQLIKVVRIYIEGVDRDPSLNSRGPTQIKIVPAAIAQRYGVTEDNLYIPKNAALATMGFLIEALAELKRRVEVNHLAFVNPATYVDYLPYIYFGSTKSLVSGSADPEHNLYIRDMKEYMGWVELYERSPAVPLQ
jgi:hypothetical protein